ncbi:hypothetical protein FRC01_002697, partial [Tulasnella sp. 417]
MGLPADTAAAYLPLQTRGPGSTFRANPGYPPHEGAYQAQAFNAGNVSAQSILDITLNGGNTLEGAAEGRAQNPGIAGRISIQQHPSKAHKQDSSGATSNAPAIKGFPSRLYRLMQDPAAKAYMYWDEQGIVVVIPDQGQLENANLLSQYFSHNKFDSLVRQFNNYGFQKLNRVSFRSGEHRQFHYYSHPNFRRGREDLLSEVKSKPKGSEPLTEPIRCAEGQQSTHLAGQDGVSRIAATQGSFEQTVFTSREDTGQLSRKFYRMNESVVALENRNTLLENDYRRLEVENRALRAENEELKKTNTGLLQCLGSMTNQINSLKMCLIRWMGPASLYMTGDN